VVDPGELPLEALIGREREIEQLLDLVRRERLVSVTGLGGTGKTRLAREVQRRWRADGGEAAFVDLSPVQDPGAVASRVFDALAADGTPRPPAEEAATAVETALAGRQILLVIDNFEQVTGAGAEVARWLRAAPGAAALVTTRVPLGLRGEWRYPLDPLSTPAADMDEDAVLASPAGALFVREARRLGGLETLGAEDAGLVTEICRRLGGMPLALEITAARARMLGLRATAEGLRSVSSPGGALDGVLEWTMSLLEPGDRDRLLGLGIVPGPFDPPLLEALWATSDPLATLEHLVDLSLVRPAATMPGWFELLVPVREGLAGRLGRGDAFATAWEAVHGYLLEAAERLDRIEPGTDLAEAYERLRRYRDLIDADLGRLLPDAADVAAPLMTALHRVCARAGLAREGAQWARRIFESGRLDPAGRSLMLSHRAMLEIEVSGPARAVPLARQAVAEAQSTEAPDVELEALGTLGMALNAAGDAAQARPIWDQALTLSRAEGRFDREAGIFGGLAETHMITGDDAEARRLLALAADAAARAGDQFARGMVLGNLAVIEPDPAVALRMGREAWALLRPLGASSFSAWAACQLAEVALSAGEVGEARDVLISTAELVRKHGGPEEQVFAIDCVARVAHADGRSIDAAHLVGVASQLRREGGLSADRLDNPGLVALRDALQASLGRPTFERLVAEGAAMAGEGFLDTLAGYLEPPRPSPVDGRYGRLSRREREVLHLVSQGATDGDIADQLGISRKTASVHVSNLKAKVGVETRIELALEGRRLLPPLDAGRT